MYIVGLDLSGPTNTKDTACAVFSMESDRLLQDRVRTGMTDPDILHLVRELAANSAVAIGIDAPLSYNPGGGDRPSDWQLRQVLKELDGKTSSVMPPTLNRMVYLTLRGISLARMLDETAQIVEVHPGAAMNFRHAPEDAVQQFKKETAARLELLVWLEEQGLQGIAGVENPPDHYVAACAAALATWDWIRNESAWLYPAERPFHPYDFAC